MLKSMPNCHIIESHSCRVTNYYHVNTNMLYSIYIFTKGFSMKIILSLLLVFTIVFAKEAKLIEKTLETSTLPNNIELVKKQYKVKGEEYVDHETYFIYKDEKEIASFSDQRVSELFRGDIDQNGVTELVLESYSGGAHCCSTYAMYALAPKFKLIKKMPLGNSSLSIKDINGDGKKELLMLDDLFSYFESLCYACSPGMYVAVDYNAGELKLNPQLTKEISKDVLTKKLSTTNVTFKNKILYFEDRDNRYRSTAALQHFLYYIYTGEHKIALSILDNYFTYPNKWVKKVLYARLMHQIQASQFWSTIKEINDFTPQQIESMKEPLKASVPSRNVEPSTTLTQDDIHIKIDYPQQVKAGKYFTITATMTNEGTNANMGGLTLSFPQFRSMDGKVLSKKFDSITPYTPPKKMYSSIWKKNIHIKYFVIEGWETKWKAHTKRYMKIKLKAPKDLSSIDVNIRGILIRGKGKYKKESINPNSATTYDQQGYAVKQLHIEVTK